MSRTNIGKKLAAESYDHSIELPQAAATATPPSPREDILLDCSYFSKTLGKFKPMWFRKYPRVGMHTWRYMGHGICIIVIIIIVVRGEIVIVHMLLTR